MLRLAGFLAALLVLSLTVAACGSGGKAHSARKATPQWAKDKKYLDENLANQVNSKPGYPVLTRVRCVHSSGRTFTCIANTADGGDNISLTAVCDGLGTDASCAVTQNP